MNHYLPSFVYLVGLCSLLLTSCGDNIPTSSLSQQPAWPEITSDTKVWTRWWWHGSAVTKEGITSEMETLQEAGFGGLELTPIFGVIGEEEDFVAYLSPRWMELLDHTLAEAQRLGMQIDMATGTGWPFGGPWVTPEDACKYLAHKTYTLSAGEQLKEKVVYTQEPIFRRINNGALLLHQASEASGIPYAELDPKKVFQEARKITLEDIKQPISANEDLQMLALDQIRFAEDLPLLTLMAYSDQGQVIDLTENVSANGTLNWTAPLGQWTLYALFTGQHGKMVERAAPGGEGNVIDHFSKDAINHYLQRFNTAFEGHDVSLLRAFFNDSYEVDDARGQANFTPSFFAAFAEKRGYNLREHLPALFGQSSPEENARILSDFRETFSDLILETFTQEWNAWADDQKAMVRNQAHGSPANILDLYAASDIPEAEGTERLRIKFASSAAHVTGQPLVAAEAATWLDEHFVANWANLKENLDRYLVNGVNHLVYHGNTYSPKDDAFPGRLFYAAFHANSRNPMWKDLRAVNEYVTRTQSFLQQGTSANDILLYFPIYDRFATTTEELLQHFDGHGPHLDETAVAEIGEQLLDAGYTFDFISDKQLQKSTFNGAIHTEGGSYKTIIVPATQYIPVATFATLMELAKSGATIIFQEELPVSVPGWGDLQQRQEALNTMKNDLTFNAVNGQSAAKVGTGQFILASQWEQALASTGIQAEAMVKQGLAFSRRNYQDGQLYFITNWTDATVDNWVSLAAVGATAVLFDPMTGAQGTAQTKPSEAGTTDVMLQLAPGSSLLVWVSPNDVEGNDWPYYQKTATEMVLAGPWSVEFLQGGPTLPAKLNLPQVAPWNEQPEEAYHFFSGTGRYQTTFERPSGTGEAYLLDLGKVYETASIQLNGRQLATLVGPTYQLLIPAVQLQQENTLTIDVSNRLINRIIKMDRDKLPWKKFYNTNIPPRLRENAGPLGIFDAAKWEPVASGLAGPVTLTSLEKK
ncbi:glycosyl hydrolase [Lewinella sp. LCG006]|uniref:glycosyl hydrolase n=1 Tax=Lewinella sp. LCG006 TaxID=3231911 RepID=UPI00345F25D7